ncbi:MAG: alpha/beta hydrolase [Christensenellales bacterium]|jgi:enterochelin esterase-like enzyme
MNYINPPQNPPTHVTHRTFYSKALNHEIGYNIYLPPDYEDSGARYPVLYHLHGWTGNESSEIWTLERTYSGGGTIVVFPNNSPVIDELENLPVETMVIHDLIPHIDGEYRTDASRESRTLSGFSMGGGMAFLYAIKHPELFSGVTAYAGTYHHYYNRGFDTVGVTPEAATALYREMISEGKDLEEGNILYWVRKHAEDIRETLYLELRVGTEDILFGDNEILHMYLQSLDIPHTYRKFEGVAHELSKLIP